MNLGCPKKCAGYTCVDVHPKDSEVIRADALQFLGYHQNFIDEIYSKNMLEHMANPGALFSEAFTALKVGGKLTIITDNAQWLPFYIPIVNRWGFGAHSSNAYFENYRYEGCGPHYALFTELHLKNHMVRAGFSRIQTRTILGRLVGEKLPSLGARIFVEGIKP